MENSAAHMRLAAAVAKGRLSGVDAMTAPTPSQLMAGSLAALGAAGAPAIAAPVDPDERVRLAVQELRDAMRARWPERHECLVDRSEDHNGAAAVMVAAVRPETEDEA